ncbi:tRNA pseudouridine55 synthase [Austwickia chelonae]|uniref:tRNA pseudouridine synthase B n=1 Tax=Austwickia chelonae NBRC 105200 TaxID=1184607 RepID=K6V394_9MICO|nr:tRNA pseudouridine(55) synthase TruB [Austwickia chelonae]GAB76508.1 tRNA pseudouridine synthase B [Austwickia chelonae NBRC 105200]SEW25923.1 tRNA pseudouridine55 synthase [Austwickia chelonae]
MARPPDPLVGDGLLLVDKPSGMTSHDVVGRCRRICGTRRVGHAGTLDPMATGLLLIGVNKATRLLTFLVGCDKTYLATIRLGQSTVTDDAEGELTGAVDVLPALEEKEIDAAIARLTGSIEQVPSAVSAIKVDGVRSYARVRGGEQVDLPARAVQVYRFERLGTRRGEAMCVLPDGKVDLRPYVDVEVRVEVSSGTYVRALARDLGAELGVGGHLTSLRRTRVGSFDVERSSSPQALEEARVQASPGRSGLPMIGMAAALEGAMPYRDLDERSAKLLSNGVRIDAESPGRDLVAVRGPAGELIAVVDEGEAKVKVRAVFVSPG